jgi:hypothetical protein
MSKFNEGTESTYAELPTAANYLYWKRGNGQLEHLKESDPGQYFGGWSAMYEGDDGLLPELPLPVVTRKSDDGKASYKRYASNVINFLPIASRMRYEQRAKAFDPKTGREIEKVVAVTKEYISGTHKGYQPMKQIYGLVFSNDMKSYAPAVLKLNKWSSFISFNSAVATWKKIKTAENMVLIRRYGTVGLKDGNGVPFCPNFVTFNDGKSTPIDAVDIAHPIIIPVDPEFDTLWDDAQAWAKCEKWNASIAVVPQDSLPPMPEYGDEFPFGDPNEV